MLASPTTGTARWAGDTSADRLIKLRRTLAAREVPLTLERAPWSVRSVVGHFGAYREGVGPLVAGLRKPFDPTGVLVQAAEATECRQPIAGASPHWTRASTAGSAFKPAPRFSSPATKPTGPAAASS